jgi:hypothetical protein
MTIALQPIKFRYQGNGATASFSFANKIYDETDLIVEILDRTTSALTETLTYVTHYSVSIAANGYATVTITNPAKIPSNTQDILLRASFPFTQTAEFNSGTVLPAETIENMGDKLTSIVQQLDESFGRSLKYNAQSPVTNPTIANPVADATLAFDGTTGALKAGATLGDISNAAANATSAAVSAATASAASAAAQAANGGIGRVVRLATSGNVTLSGLQTIDGVVGADGDRILVRTNTTSSQNGIYLMASGAWTRATDANTWSSFVGMIVTVAEGAARKNHVYISLATQGGTLDTTAITFDTVPIDGHVTTAKLADNAVTPAKLSQLAAYSINANNTNATADQTTVGLQNLYPQSFQIGATVAANALTATLQPTPITFRNSSLGSGAINNRMVTTVLSLTIPSGATLGTVNAVQSRLVLLAIDNAGTVELAVVNIAGGNQLDETNLISTTAISAGSTSANTIYSTTARTSVPYRVVGFIESTQTTAGTWATAPSTIQGCGGQALVAMGTLGYGQTWQSLTGSRALSTTYTNTTSKPIQVIVSAVSNLGGSGTANMSATVNGVSIGSVMIEYYFSSTVVAFRNALYFIVPPGNTYVVTPSVASTLISWAELR